MNKKHLNENILNAVKRGISNAIDNYLDKHIKYKDGIELENLPKNILDEFINTLYNLPYDEYFVSSCSDRLEEMTDDEIREELMDGFCELVAHFMYKEIPNLGSEIKCFYLECRDGLDYHYVFYSPKNDLYYDAYNVEGVKNLLDLEFVIKYNKPYKYQSEEFPGRKTKYTELELKSKMFDVTDDAIKLELFKYGNIKVVREKQNNN